MTRFPTSPKWASGPAPISSATTSSPPPSGAAGYFGFSNQVNAIQLYRFQPNFSNPSASSFNDGFGGNKRLVLSHSVDPDGAGPKVACVRLYEIANPGSAVPSFANNVTYSPDAADRWMSSAAMDKQGKIAVGHSVTGRLAGEPANTLRNEAVLINGTGSQTGGLSRWGDDSAMRIDPVDDCTFWFASEYMGSTGSFNWRTGVASAKSPGRI